MTESFQLAPTAMLRVYWALLGWARGRTNRNGMRETLERIKAEVEIGPEVEAGPAGEAESPG